MRRRRSATENRTPSQTDGEDPSDRGPSSGSRRRGSEDSTSRDRRRAKKGIALFMAKSQVPTTGPARCSVAASVPTSTPLLYSSASDGTRSGTIGLQRGVVDRPPARVDEHDEDQEASVIRSLRMRNAPASDGDGTQHVRDGHERAACEPVGERAGRQGQQEPRQAVRSHHARDGQRVGVDDDGQERDRPGRHSVPGAGQGEADPEAGEGATELLPPDAVLRPATDAHGALCRGPAVQIRQALAWCALVPLWLPGATAAGAALSVKQIAKGGSPPCRKS